MLYITGALEGCITFGLLFMYTVLYWLCWTVIIYDEYAAPVHLCIIFNYCTNSCTGITFEPSITRLLLVSIIMSMIWYVCKCIILMLLLTHAVSRPKLRKRSKLAFNAICRSRFQVTGMVLLWRRINVYLFVRMSGFALVCSVKGRKPFVFGCQPRGPCPEIH